MMSLVGVMRTNEKRRDLRLRAVRHDILLFLMEILQFMLIDTLGEKILLRIALQYPAITSRTSLWRAIDISVFFLIGQMQGKLQTFAN